MTVDLAEQARALPDKPGVYLFRNARGETLYVGKAANLRARVRSYFGSPTSLEGKTRALMARVADLEYITTDTEQQGPPPGGDARQAPSALLQRPPQGR